MSLPKIIALCQTQGIMIQESDPTQSKISQTSKMKTPQTIFI